MLMILLLYNQFALVFILHSTVIWCSFLSCSPWPYTLAIRLKLHRCIFIVMAAICHSATFKIYQGHAWPSSVAYKYWAHLLICCCTLLIAFYPARKLSILVLTLTGALDLLVLRPTNLGTLVWGSWSIWVGLCPALVLYPCRHPYLLLHPFESTNLMVAIIVQLVASV